MSEDGDWAEVARVVDERLEELGLSQKGLAKRAGLSQATVRAVQPNYGKHRHKPGTLAALSGRLSCHRNILRTFLTAARSRNLIRRHRNSAWTF